MAPSREQLAPVRGMLASPFHAASITYCLAQPLLARALVGEVQVNMTSPLHGINYFDTQAGLSLQPLGL